MTRFSTRAVALVLALSATSGITACNSHEDDPWNPIPSRIDVPRSPLGDPDQENFYAREQASPETSEAMFAATIVFSLGGMLACCAILWWMHSRRARLEERFDPKAPLRDGVSVVFGRVETETHEPAVTIRIEQVGREWQYKGAWNHAWEEFARDVRARPFILRTPSGQAVRVEPTTDVAIHGELSRTDRHGHTQRSRVLEVANGAEVHVYGVLAGAQQAAAGAYRQAASTPVLTGTAFAPMVISTEKPGATARARAGVHRNMGIAMLAWLVFAVSVVFSQFAWLSLDGDVVPTTMEATREWREYVKPKNSPGYWRYHYEIRGRANGNVVADEVGRPLYDCVRNGGCPTVPFVVSSLRPAVHQYGSEPHTSGPRIAIGVIAALIFSIVYPAVSLSTRPWYMKKRLKEGGAGTIADGDARDEKLRMDRAARG